MDNLKILLLSIILIELIGIFVGVVMETATAIFLLVIINYRHKANLY